MITDFIYVNS